MSTIRFFLYMKRRPWDVMGTLQKGAGTFQKQRGRVLLSSHVSRLCFLGAGVVRLGTWAIRRITLGVFPFHAMHRAAYLIGMSVEAEGSWMIDGEHQGRDRCASPWLGFLAGDESFVCT